MTESSTSRSGYMAMTKAELVDEIERLEARHARQAAEQAHLLRSTLEGMNQGVMVIGPDDHIVAANGLAAELLEVPETLLKGRPHFSEVIRYQTENQEILGQLIDQDLFGQEKAGQYGKAPSTHDVWSTLLRGNVERYRRENPDGIMLEITNKSLDGGWVVRTVNDVTEEHSAKLKLEESEKLLRETLDNLDASVLVTDAEDRHLLGNKKLFEQHPLTNADDIKPGMTYEEVLRILINAGEFAEEIKKFGAEAFVQERVKMRREEGETSTIQLTNGKWVFARKHVTEDGKNIRFHLDITERVRLEEDLSQKEAELRMVLKNMPGGVRYIDSDRRYVFYNDQYLELWDLPGNLFNVGDTIEAENEFLVKRGDLTEADLDEFTDGTVKAQQFESGPQHYERTTRSGRILECFTHPAANGGFVSIFTDITKRKHAEKKLAEQARYLELTLESMDEGLLLIDADFKVILQNQNLSNVLDIPENFLAAGDTLQKLVDYQIEHGEYDEQFLNSRNEKKPKPNQAVLEPDIYERERPNGNWIHVVGRPLKEGGYLHTYRDITERRNAENNLKRSEERLKFIFEHSPVAIEIARADGTIVFANARAGELFGLSVKDLVGSNIVHLYTDPERRRKIYDMLERRESVRDLEVEFRRPDGSSVTALVNAEEMEFDGQTGVVGWLYDITERRLMEDTLAQQKSMLQVTMDNMVQGLMVVNAEGRAVLFNKNLCKMLDLPEQLMASRPTVRDIWDYQEAQGEFDELSKNDRATAAVRAENVFVEHEESYERRRPNGTYLLLTTNPMPGGGFIRTYLDVTERHKAEAELERQRELLKNSINNMEQGILVMDRDDRIVLYNNRVCDLLETPGAYFDQGPTNSEFWKYQEKMGEFALLPKERKAELDEWVDTKRRREFDGYERMRPDGTHLWVIINPLPDGGLVETYTDITNRKETEAELAAAKQEAEDSNRAKSAFLASMSHEIRTPLSGITGFLELLEYSGLDDDQRSMVRSANLSARHLIDLIGDVLDFSKIEAGHLDLAIERVSPRTILDEAISVVAPLAQEKHVALYGQMSPLTPAWIMADPIRLRQIIVNLVGNAVKFSENGTVHVDVFSELSGTSGGWEVRFEVTDTGIGFDPKTIPDLFSEFRQADDSTTRRFGGTGLGLAISQRLVNMMDGRIGCDAEPGRGAFFWFTLPIHEPDFDRIECAQGGGKSVLLIADEGEDNSEISDLLTAAGCNISLGLHKEAQPDNPFDAVVALGEMAGPASEDIKTASNTRILLTADREFSTKADALYAGFTHIVPWELRKLSLVHHLGESDRLFSDLLPGETENVIPENFIEQLRVEIAGLPILVIDDIEMNRQIAGRQLEKLSLKFDTAVNGQDGLERIAETRYAALIVDVSMPVMDGYDFTKYFRQWEEAQRDQNRSRTPVIALTANVTADDAQKCIAAGMDDYMSKPLTLARLTQMLLKWLGDTDAEPRSAVPDGRGELTEDSRSPIDFDELSEILGTDDTAEQKEYLLEYVSHAQGFVAELDDSLNAQDRNAIRATAHSACGSARYAGARSLAETYFSIETSAQDATWADLSKSIETTKEQLARVESLANQLGE